MSKNPFEPTCAETLPPHAPFWPWFTMLASFVAFLVVSVVLWVFPLLYFFGDSKALWPGFACAAPALLGGLGAARLCAAILPLTSFTLAACTFLAAASTLFFRGVERQESLGSSPSPGAKLAWSHVILMLACVVSVLTGLSGCFVAFRLHRNAEYVFNAICAVCCIGFLVLLVANL